MRTKQLQRERGSQLLEFALTVPILLLLVVGAWDFGSAFVLKEKLTNAAREGARIVVSNSLVSSPTCAGNSIPCPITSAENAVVQYLNNAGLNASCLGSATVTTTYSPGPPPAGLAAWTWSCNGITLAINRWDAAGLDTSVSLTYPVQWSISNFFGVTVIPSQITTQVAMPNLTY